MQGKIRPGYKQTEVGVIPEDWEVTELSSTGHIERGKFSARPRNDPKFYGGSIPFIQTGDIANCNGFLSDYSQTLNDIGLGVSKLFPQGSLFLTIAANIGDVAISTFDSACPDSLVVISTKPDVDSIWLLNELTTHKESFENLASPGAQLNINLEKLRPYLIPLPPFPEQRAIAAALSDADGLIGALGALIAKKRDLKQAAMQQLLTGKTRLPGFSGEWEVKRLGELAAIRNDKINTLDAVAAAFCVELEQIGQNTGHVDGYTDARNRRSVKYHFRKNDVLFGRLRPYLRKFWWADRNGVCSTEIWPLVPLSNQLVSGFLFQIVRTDEFVEAANSSYGTHMPRSDWKALRQFEVLLPSNAEEQTAIAEVLSDMDADLAALAARRDKAKAIKQGMMQELLTGRVRLI